MRIFTVIRPHQSRHQRPPERDQPATVPGALVRRRTVPGGVINNYHRAA